MTGDTDDDASVHLYKRVGPSMPPASHSATNNQRIIDILNEGDDKRLYSRDYNSEFRIFQQTGNVVGLSEPESEYDDDTEVEDADDSVNAINSKISNAAPALTLRARAHPDAAITQPRGWFASSRTSRLFIGVASSLLLVVVVLVLALSQTSTAISGLTTITLANKIRNLEATTFQLAEKHKALEVSQSSLTASLNAKFDVISAEFRNMKASLLDSHQYESLHNEFENLKESVALVLHHSDPKGLESQLNKVTKELDKLSRIGSDIEHIKQDILNTLLGQLPDMIPIYVKDKKLHFIPEFQRFLYSFIEKYNHENPIWDNEELVAALRSHAGEETLAKDQLEQFLKTKMDANNKAIWSKVTELVENLSLADQGNATLARATNQVLLDNLLDVFAQGSVKLNYADYNLGARILGFLTRLAPESGVRRNKSLARKVFLGWYDYIKGPKEWKYNANNVLLDGGDYWECLANECSIGIRLFTPVIATDLIVKGASLTQPDTGMLSSPSKISLFIKPKNPHQVEPVQKLLSAFSDAGSLDTSHDKYLSKFINVKTFDLNPMSSVNQLRLPISLVNMRVPIRDMYLQIHCEEGSRCAVFNIRVYGISEHNAYKLTNDVSLMAEKLQHGEAEGDRVALLHTTNAIYVHSNDALGDDEPIW